MANKYYPKITKPRVSQRTFEGLVGQVFPNTINKKDDGAYGKYIDALIKAELQVFDPGNGNPDLSDYDIELKSKYDESDTMWTIANMSVNDILNTDYINSPVYRKLQSVLLVSHNKELITEVELIYLDNDDAQLCIKECYESVRQQLKNYVHSNGASFSSSKQFKEEVGVLEYSNIGQQFKFRIRSAHFKTIVNMSANVSIRDQFFDFS